MLDDNASDLRGLLDHGALGLVYALPMRPIPDIRRARLLELIRDHGEGNASAFARLIGKSRAHVGFWTADADKPGARNINHTSARALERRFSKPAGWMDTDPEGVKGASQQGSQVSRPDPDILTRTHLFLANAGGYDLANGEDAELFADAYEWIAEKEEASDVAPDNLVNFRQWVMRRGMENAGSNERTEVAGKARKKA